MVEEVVVVEEVEISTFTIREWAHAIIRATHESSFLPWASAGTAWLATHSTCSKVDARAFVEPTRRAEYFSSGWILSPTGTNLRRMRFSRFMARDMDFTITVIDGSLDLHCRRFSDHQDLRRH